MERIPLRLKVLTVEVGEPWKAVSLKGSPQSKYILLQAHQRNQGMVFLVDDPDKEDGICFRTGFPPLPFDVDTDRLVGVDLSNLYLIGGCVGDKLVVAYLEEHNG